MLLLKKLPVVLAGAMLDLTGKYAMLKDVKKGDFIRRKPESKKTYKKGDYDQTSKKYCLVAWESGEDIYLSGKTIVFIDFTY